MNADDCHRRFDLLLELGKKLGLKSLTDAWKSQELELRNPRVQMVILGEFNHGKSSLINGLIGESVLPFGVTPTTQIDTCIRFGNPERIVIAYSGNNEVCRWTWDEWLKTENRSMPGTEQSQIIDRLEILLDSEPFESCCIIMDTPGLNEAFLSRESYLRRYINRADLLIFVFDANQVMTHTEQTVIRELADGLASSQRILVINKCDRLDEEEWLDICHYVESTLSPVLGDERFYMVSARKKGIGDWQDLNARIREGIAERKHGHELESLCRQNNEMAAILEGALLLYQTLKSMPKSERKTLLHTEACPALSALDLARFLHDISLEMTRLIRQTRCDMERFESDFLKAMPRELDKAQLDDIEQYFEDFIDESYASFSESVLNRLVEALRVVWNEACQKLLQSFDIQSNEVGFLFSNVEMLRANPVSTGAFDLSGMGLWDLPLPGVIASRAERPRREALRNMARTAIVRRAEQYIQAFECDLSHHHDVLATFFRECGLQIRDYILELSRSVSDDVDFDEAMIGALNG